MSIGKDIPISDPQKEISRIIEEQDILWFSDLMSYLGENESEELEEYAANHTYFLTTYFKSRQGIPHRNNRSKTKRK